MAKPTTPSYRTHLSLHAGSYLTMVYFQEVIHTCIKTGGSLVAKGNLWSAHMGVSM